MMETNVVLVPIRGAAGVRWMLRRTPGWIGAGWARFDGSFTPGFNLYNEAESEYVVSSPLRDELVEFAQEQGWQIVTDVFKRMAV